MKFVKLLPFRDDITFSYNLEAGASIDDNEVTFTYLLSGDFSKVILNDTNCRHERKWDLWEKTCFEAFLKHKDFPWYIEFNFAPTSEWNCFYVKNYRENDGEYNSVTSVKIKGNIEKDRCVLSASVGLQQLQVFRRDDFDSGNINLGLTAVIEESAEKQYFAIKHTANDPDFHAIDSFCYHLKN